MAKSTTWEYNDSKLGKFVHELWRGLDGGGVCVEDMIVVLREI